MEMIELVLSDTAARAEDESSQRLAALFDSQHQRLYRIALRMVTDDDAARDLVQETFLRAATKVESLPDDGTSAEAWLVRVLVNLCNDRFRRLKVRRDHVAMYPLRDGAEDHEEAVVAASTVKRALAKLSPRRRAIVVLHELEGLDDRNIAKLLGITAVTVRWHLAKAKRELVEIISQGRKR